MHLIKDNALFSTLELKLFKTALVGHTDDLEVGTRRLFKSLLTKRITEHFL